VDRDGQFWILDFGLRIECRGLGFLIFGVGSFSLGVVFRVQGSVGCRGP